MTFKEKIDKLLSISGKKFNSVYDLEVQSGVGMGTIRKAYDENREPSKRIIWKFLETLSINPEWWESGIGNIYLENGTGMQKSSDNKEKPAEEIYRWLEDTDYTLVPKAIIDVLRKDIDANSKKFQDIIDSKNEFIEDLKNQLADLRAGRVVVIPPPQQSQ